MVIRTGILAVPQVDDEAANRILQLLRANLPTVLLLQNSSASSQRHWIEEILRNWCDEEELDLVITIGGTAPAPGPAPVEIVPDATSAIVERNLPGLAEAMRSYAAQEIALAWLERGIVGIRGRSLLINLPAGAAPALLFLEAIIDLIEPTLAYLHESADAPRLADLLEVQLATDALDEDAESTPKQTTGLDPSEFAAFLQRRQ